MPSVPRGRSKSPLRTQPAVRSPSNSKKTATPRKTRAPSSSAKKKAASPSAVPLKSPRGRSGSSSPTRRSGGASTKHALVRTAGAAYLQGELTDTSKTFTHAPTAQVARKPFIKRVLGSWGVECAYFLFEPWEQVLTLLLYAVVLSPLVWSAWNLISLLIRAVGYASEGVSTVDTIPPSS